MKRHWLFGILASSFLMLIVGARPAAGQAVGSHGSGHSGTSGHNGTGRLAQRNQDQTQRDAEAQKAAEDAKQKAEAKKQAAAKKLEDAKKKAEAIKLAKKAVDSSKPAAKAAAPDTSEQDAAKLCDEAEKKFAEGKIDSVLAGVNLLDKVLDDYGSTDAAAKAETRLDQILGMPDVGPKIMLAQGNDLFTAQRYRKAQNAFMELVAAFPNSPEAAEANERLAEIRNGNLLDKTVYTDKELDDARLWLLAGNIHEENSRRSDAVSAWRKVVEDYPGCRFAKEATQQLAGMPKP